MEVYRRLATCQTPEDLDQLARDLADAYGPVPPVVDDLLTVALIRVMAGRAGIVSIVLDPPDVVFTVDDKAQAGAALAGLAGTVRTVDERTIYWRPPPAYLERPTLLLVLRRQLQGVAARP
jgi:transcription-repair coupling factor (superfamily II helicase)